MDFPRRVLFPGAAPQSKQVQQSPYSCFVDEDPEAGGLLWWQNPGPARVTEICYTGSHLAEVVLSTRGREPRTRSTRAVAGVLH